MNYEDTVIYRLKCRDENVKECYVGHTTNYRGRINAHRQSSRNKNYKVYQFIRDTGGWENWTSEILERGSYEDGNEARQRERHWYETLGATLNTTYPARTKRETQRNYIDNHREEHRRRVVEYDSERLEVVCPECDNVREITRQQFRKSKNNHKCRSCVRRGRSPLSPPE